MSGAIIQNPPKNLEVQCKLWRSIVRALSSDRTISAQTLDDGKQCYNKDPSRSFPNNRVDCSGSAGGSDNGNAGSNVLPPASPPSSVSQSAPPPSSAPSPSQSNTTPSNNPPTSNSVPEVEQHQAVSSSTSGGSSTGNGPASGTLEVTKPTVSPSDGTTPQSDKSTTTGQAGDVCPPNGWFPGCVWGSGPGNLGASCTQKTDCRGEFICINGKCADNTKRLMMRGVHWRRYLHLYTQ